MHIESVTAKASSLKQGSIFKIEPLLFDGQRNGQPISLRFQDLYPEIDLTDVKYGVVFTQSCDLSRELDDKGKKRSPSVPYITVGFIEPISRWFLKKPIRVDRTLTVEVPGDIPLILIDKVAASKKMTEVLLRLIQNNDPVYFFLHDQEQAFFSFSYVNLTKAVPIRIQNYDQIADASIAGLTREFQGKLAWKLASLYGRSGARDYEKDEISSIVDELLPAALPNGVGLGAEEFDQCHKLWNNGSKATRVKDILDIVANELSKKPNMKSS